MQTVFTDPTAIAPIAGVIVMLSTLLVGARYAATRLALPGGARTRLLLGAALFFGAWAAIMTTFAVNGSFIGSRDAHVPPVAYGLVLPMLAALVAIASSPTVRAALRVIPERLLVGVQLYRVLGGVFLVLLAQGRMPREFALPAGVGDIGVGVAALLLALTHDPRARWWRSAAIAWNVIGITDLVVAVTTGVLTAPGRLQHLAFDTPNAIIATFPYVLIPTVLVPISLLLHGASLYRLRAEPRADRATSAAPAASSARPSRA